ncbi:hypothetical protein BDBG_17627 [Blastomyces gilchristii SLH14081]|uniref:Uncharacterized protein n=1 Tax=Blastomyces gilchristii (strain SLH14081) TaxID=559298 RepID=A0A179UVI7_BLAGS|nr:uncharacterized protein BDBG_17627 [Blastomyces gilchristii SLH14081]OAT12136.1 hypothetical protein BDBG_17627 [Blastomyces gilchristii SLH14081]
MDPSDRTQARRTPKKDTLSSRRRGCRRWLDRPRFAHNGLLIKVGQSTPKVSLSLFFLFSF